MFKRRPTESAPVAPMAPSPEFQLPEMQRIDPHAFITAHQKDFQASINAWSQIAGGTLEKEPEYREYIRSGLIDVRQANNVPLPDEETLERETDKLKSELTVYSLLTARYVSELDTHVPIAQVKHYIQKIPDHTVHYILNQKDFPRRRFMVSQGTRVGNMRLADGYAKKVLGDLTAIYSSQPQELTTLAGLYDAGAVEMDSRYRELQTMIGTDWHHPNAEKSILKNFVISLSHHPDVFVPSFVRKVAAAEKEHKLLTIQNMARFAIVASGTKEVGEEKIAGLLASTYSTWGDFDDIDTAFRTYMQSEINDLTKLLTTIAGPRNLKNIRTLPTVEEVGRLKDHFTALHTPTRQSRRRRERIERKTKRIHELPDFEDIDRVAQEVARPDPRKIMKAKSTPEGYVFIDTPVGELLSSMKFSSTVVARDIKNVIVWLQSNTISGASQKLRGGVGERLTHDGKQLALWRLAPNRIQELTISSRDSRRMRIVYALLEDAVIIVDVLDHDTFDQRYAGG